MKPPRPTGPNFNSRPLSDEEKLKALRDMQRHFETLPKGSIYARHRLKMVKATLQLLEIQRSVDVTSMQYSTVHA